MLFLECGPQLHDCGIVFAAFRVKRRIMLGLCSLQHRIVLSLHDHTRFLCCLPDLKMRCRCLPHSIKEMEC